MDAARKTARRPRDDDIPPSTEKQGDDHRFSKKIKTEHTVETKDGTECEDLFVKKSEAGDISPDPNTKNETKFDKPTDEKAKPKLERNLSDMYIDLDYLPASAPCDHPHVLNLSQKAVVKALQEKSIPLTQPDIIVTILYNYNEQLLKDFLGLTGLQYVHFRTHEYERRRHDTIELPSIVIVRARSQITVSMQTP